MCRLWLAALGALMLALLFYGAGCSRRSLDYRGDGGVDGGTCGSRPLESCTGDSRCEVQPGCCGGPSSCVDKGTQHGCECPLDCHSLDEKSCAATGGACVADYCLECSCTPTFVGCRLPTEPQTTCPGLGCAQPNCSCDGLSESECIASESTLGCTPNYCTDCEGGEIWNGCTGPNEGAPACPGVCPQMGCHDQSECSGGQECLAPGASAGCGICKQGDGCTSDGDCAPGEICGFDPCVCTGNGMSCGPGCSQTGCPDGQVCNQTDHCADIPCSDTSQCPTFFTCIFPPGPGNPHCQRMGCGHDADCGAGGYCVQGQCYSTLGTCTFPPA